MLYATFALIGGIVLLLLWLAWWLFSFAWWWLIARNRPEFPPVPVPADDPLMLEAIDAARASIPQLRELFAESPEHAKVKIPFVTNGGETELLWADLLSLEGEEMTVRYMTPPVSHTGKIERVHRHPLGDLYDWIYTKDPKRYLGGFTMRVTFVRAKEFWGELPRKLAAEQERYPVNLP